MAVCNASRFTGLGRQAVMPEASRRSRSACRLCAVIPTMGVMPRAIQRLGRLLAVHDRHHHVHQHDVEMDRRTASTAAAPFSTMTVSQPSSPSRRSRT